MRKVGGAIVLASSVIMGCQPQPKMADLSEPEVMQQACEVAPPQIIHVPVPVPMPCQLKPEPVFETVSTRRGKKTVQRVANRADGAAGINSVQEYAYMQ